MKLTSFTLAHLAESIATERKRQGLSREDAAAVCGVSTSFIRDAESHPEHCTLGKLVQLINGLGLSLEISSPPITPPSRQKAKVNFGVPKSQIAQPTSEDHT